MLLKYGYVEKVRRVTKNTTKLTKKVQSYPGALQTHENINNVAQVRRKSSDFVNVSNEFLTDISFQIFQKLSYLKQVDGFDLKTSFMRKTCNF
jgi:hypothetical protein